MVLTNPPSRVLSAVGGNTWWWQGQWCMDGWNQIVMNEEPRIEKILAETCDIFNTIFFVNFMFNNSVLFSEKKGLIRDSATVL